MNENLTILVNTSDKFEDCWPPFFTLFRQYWPDCPYPIVLNTETKDFRFDGLNVFASKVAVDETRPLKWGHCLIRCLDGISSPYVLYLQEDYFLEGPVRSDMIAAFLDELGAGRADVIRLMEFEGAGPWHSSAHQLLWEVDCEAMYRVSLQAALCEKAAYVL